MKHIDELERKFALEYAQYLIETTALQVAARQPWIYDLGRISPEMMPIIDDVNAALDEVGQAAIYLDYMGRIEWRGRDICSIRVNPDVQAGSVNDD